MSSALTWLDVSAEQQRRVRDMIRLFEEPGTRDELGVGPVRDAFSELLFRHLWGTPMPAPASLTTPGEAEVVAVSVVLASVSCQAQCRKLREAFAESGVSVKLDTHVAELLGTSPER